MSAYLMPLAVRLASERVRADAANTMRHDTTSDLSARLMCRVGVHDLGLVMAWVDQFAALALLPGGMVPDGYVLVPREPTEAMVKSGQRAADDKYWLWRGLGERPVGSGLDGMALYVDAAYRAMLSASPKEVSHER
ncbi:MAG: hypothetical protein KAZ48_10725 [Candidatus Nanopelagicales bacterium]|nr:hypothetical protein [Candidatus Nanopelagicales bacterium]